MSNKLWYCSLKWVYLPWEAQLLNATVLIVKLFFIAFCPTALYVSCLFPCSEVTKWQWGSFEASISAEIFSWAGKGGGAGLKSMLLLVHPADNTRMDLIIPGEQYFYLKARNAVERQKWLVALGTAKACLTDSRTQKEKGKKSLLLSHVCILFPQPLVDETQRWQNQYLISVSNLCFRPLVLINTKMWEL